jgi:hypothetical protein
MPLPTARILADEYEIWGIAAELRHLFQESERRAGSVSEFSDEQEAEAQHRADAKKCESELNVVSGHAASPCFR